MNTLDCGVKFIFSGICFQYGDIWKTSEHFKILDKISKENETHLGGEDQNFDKFVNSVCILKTQSKSRSEQHHQQEKGLLIGLFPKTKQSV